MGKEEKMATILVSVVVSIAAIIGLTSYYFAGADNKVEQACEDIIKIETGEEIDLSPNEDGLKQSPKIEQEKGANGTSQPQQ